MVTKVDCMCCPKNINFQKKISKKCRCEKKRRTKNGFYILNGYGLDNVFIHNYNYKNEI